MLGQKGGLLLVFLVKNKMPLTVDKLFEAAKFIRKSGQIRPVMDVDVDDDFGSLSQVLKSEKSIKEQVLSGITNMSLEATDKVVEDMTLLDATGASLTKTNLLAKQVMDITIKSFIMSMSHSRMTLANKLSPDELRQEPLKEVEALFEALESNSAATSSEGVSSEVHDTLRLDPQLLSKFVKANPEIVRDMIKNDMPMTPDSLERAFKLNREPFKLLTRIREMIDSVDNTSVRDNLLQKVASSSRIILNGEEPMSVLKETLSDIEREIHANNQQVTGNMSDTASDIVKTMNHTQMLQVTEDYYQIPVMMGSELSQLNMYILNNKEDSLSAINGEMKVVMQFSTRTMGKVTAYLEFSGNLLTMNLQSDDEGDKALLTSYESEIRTLVESTNFGLEGGVTYNQMSHKSPIGKMTDDGEQDNETLDVVPAISKPKYEIEV